MAERIDDHGDALPIALICSGTQCDGPRVDGPGKIGIDRQSCEVEGYGRATDRVWAQCTEVGILVGNHDGAFADLEFRVADPTVARVGHPEELLGAKGATVEINRYASILDDEVGGQGRNRGGHGRPLVAGV
ncbi:hypothetical protein VP03_29975 [Sinorhizobium meliloti]|nr:hypothetical protein VP03_29975 [Sinorhizobium meliloti]